jgi:hypothetical protein
MAEHPATFKKNKRAFLPEIFCQKNIFFNFFTFFLSVFVFQIEKVKKTGNFRPFYKTLK